MFGRFKENAGRTISGFQTGHFIRFSNRRSQHVAGTYNGATISVFVNGELSGHVPLTDGVLSAEDQTLRVGFGSAEEHMIFSGEIDALRISNVIRDIKK